MDYNVSAVERYNRDNERMADEACWNAAQKAGITAEEAENCDDGACGCPECPWKKPECITCAGLSK